MRDFRPYQMSPEPLRLAESQKLKVFSQVAASMHFLNRGFSIEALNKAADRKTLSRVRRFRSDSVLTDSMTLGKESENA